MDAALQAGIAAELSVIFKRIVLVTDVVPVSGGSINQCYRLNAGSQVFFCKINSVARFPLLFQRETEGLEQLRKTGIFKVPEVVSCFNKDLHQVLVLKWIREGKGSAGSWEVFGRKLAELHQVHAPFFGADQDNYMGSIPQQNAWMTRWTSFFMERRIVPLLELCTGKGLLPAATRKGFDRLFALLEEIFPGNIQPSLVHGDLWSGNFLFNDKGDPVLIDPAAYYGHPATDLGMTTLFGGFDRRFYESYNHYLPLPANHKQQWEVCNLYPLLVHLYLFGSSYLGRIDQTLSAFK